MPAELSAILPRHPDRMLPLLGKAGVVDDPGFDRPATLDHWQHHLANLGQDLFVRLRRHPDEMQQPLMLRRRSRRRRSRRHRLHTLALARQHQTQAVIPQGPIAVGMTDYARKPFDKTGKSNSRCVRASQIHRKPSRVNENLHHYVSLTEETLRLSDLVRLERIAPRWIAPFVQNRSERFISSATPRLYPGTSSRHISSPRRPDP